MTGRAHVYGDNINTDLIIAGKYTKTLAFEDLALHCLEDLDPQFVHKVQKEDILVAGENFGCGSSREQAPLALKYSGISAVLAKSFARIFYRNAINLGMPAVLCDTSDITEGDRLSIDLRNGIITVNGGRVVPCHRLSGVMQGILDHGGLVNYINNKGDLVL